MTVNKDSKQKAIQS